jgi:hypothetical protein
MPFGSDVVVIDTAGVVLATVTDRTTDWVCAGVPESVTEKLTAALLTAAEGVPEMTPVLADSVKPVGNAPLAIRQVYGAVPPVAASDAL